MLTIMYAAEEVALNSNVEIAAKWHVMSFARTRYRLLIIVRSLIKQVNLQHGDG